MSIINIKAIPVSTMNVNLMDYILSYSKQQYFVCLNELLYFSTHYSYPSGSPFPCRRRESLLTKNTILRIMSVVILCTYIKDKFHVSVFCICYKRTLIVFSSWEVD